jgi:3-hydroxyacyl-CoA dehydrogenase
VPEFLKTATGRTFYRSHVGALQYLCADGSYEDLERAPGVIRFNEMRRTLEPEQENAKASYFLLPQDLGLVEFHSKANTLDGESMQLVEAALAHARANCQGLIIHNDAQHFSCGVNLEGVLEFIANEDWTGLDAFLGHFQQTCLALKHAGIPVIAAPSGLSLGGGFEVVLHADQVIFHANSVTGLVETLVGVVPGGGGVKEMLHRWYDREGDVTKAAWKAFMNVGYGRTARSPLEAAPLAMYREGIDQYLMNRDRLLQSAIDTALELRDGYAPSHRPPLAMPGRDVWQDMQDWLKKAQAKGALTPHDVTTGTQIAMIVTGGDIDAGSVMTENDLCDLERKAFLTLAKSAETRARIEFMLEHGSPLRN